MSTSTRQPAPIGVGSQIVDDMNGAVWVATIVAEREENGQLQFLLSYDNWNSSYDTWRDADELKAQQAAGRGSRRRAAVSRFSEEQARISKEKEARLAAAKKAKYARMSAQSLARRVEQQRLRDEEAAEREFMAHATIEKQIEHKNLSALQWGEELHDAKLSLNYVDRMLAQSEKHEVDGDVQDGASESSDAVSCDSDIAITNAVVYRPPAAFLHGIGGLNDTFVDVGTDKQATQTRNVGKDDRGSGRGNGRKRRRDNGSDSTTNATVANSPITDHFLLCSAAAMAQDPDIRWRFLITLESSLSLEDAAAQVEVTTGRVGISQQAQRLRLAAHVLSSCERLYGIEREREIDLALCLERREANDETQNRWEVVERRAAPGVNSNVSPVTSPTKPLDGAGGGVGIGGWKTAWKSVLIVSEGLNYQFPVLPSPTKRRRNRTALPHNLHLLPELCTGAQTLCRIRQGNLVDVPSRSVVYRVCTMAVILLKWCCLCRGEYKQMTASLDDFPKDLSKSVDEFRMTTHDTVAYLREWLDIAHERCMERAGEGQEDAVRVGRETHRPPVLELYTASEARAVALLHPWSYPCIGSEDDGIDQRTRCLGARLLQARVALALLTTMPLVTRGVHAWTTAALHAKGESVPFQGDGGFKSRHGKKKTLVNHDDVVGLLDCPSVRCAKMTVASTTAGVRAFKTVLDTSWNRLVSDCSD